MFELYECAEPDCDALVEGVFCRWHHRRLPQPGTEPPVARKGTNILSTCGHCFYCGDYEGLTKDHVIPQALGRTFRRSWNVVLCCEFCNRKKANLQLADWLRKISAERGSGKYSRILGRSRGFVTELLTDHRRPEMQRYRSFIDPWWGDDPRQVIVTPSDRQAAIRGAPRHRGGLN